MKSTKECVSGQPYTRSKSTTWLSMPIWIVRPSSSTADRPKDLLRNSILTPSVAASIKNAKYVNGLPLYWISQEFLRNDIHISKQVMANWMIQCADRYLGILYDFLHKELYRFHVLQADVKPGMVSKDVPHKQ